MTFATGSHHGLTFIEEETFGTTPDTPAMTKIRHTACSLGLTKTTLETEEIRSDRQSAHLLHGQKSVSGDLDFELSYGGHDALLAALMQADWSGDILTTGSTQKSFTLERGFTDIDQYQQLTGCVINRMSLSVRPDRLVSGKFSVLGKSAGLSSTSLDDTPTAAAANDPMDSFSGSLAEGGIGIGIVAALDLTIDNNMEQAFVVGSAEASVILSGKSRISGEIVTYFEDESLLEKFINRTASSLTVTLAGEGGELEFHLPHIVYTGGSNVVVGEGPITLSLPFTALYDETETTNLKITRSAV
jgi:hypothetical protein